LDFESEDAKDRFLTELSKFKLPNCKFLQKSKDQVLQFISRAENRWIRGELSNFDYLMQINILAGRTYNDLSQYPVFPWVIADYTSPEIDFDKVETFRDLSVPIGALCDNRLSLMIERMNSATTADTRCLYNSFYMSQAVVLGYLIRVEPFTTLHIELQSGRFDLASRLFTSIPKAWESVQKSSMDFRELIPEFFYFPDFLLNRNDFDLGCIGDVELPRWCSSARDFIEKNRQALECPIVTAMLPRWIDLIFGVNSRGPEAALVNNVFSPVFFPEYITQEVACDPQRLKFAREYTACFGEAPSLIFGNPHKACKKAWESCENWSHSKSVLVDVGKPILSLECTSQAIVVVDSNFVRHTCTDSGITSLPLSLECRIEESLLSQMSKVVRTKNGMTVTGTIWDNSFAVSNESGRKTWVKRRHTQKVSCIAMSRNYFATCGYDCTAMIWRLPQGSPPFCVQVLGKHKARIVCSEISEENDILVTCDEMGEICVTALASGDFVKKVKCGGVPCELAIFHDGFICVAFESNTVVVFDLNLNEICTKNLGEMIVGMTCVVWGDGRRYLFVGTAKRRLRMFEVLGMGEVWNEEIEEEIMKIGYWSFNRSVVIGTRNGRLIFIPYYVV
jgi:hypothetical protein